MNNIDVGKLLTTLVLYWNSSNRELIDRLNEHPLFEKRLLHLLTLLSGSDELTDDDVFYILKKFDEFMEICDIQFNKYKEKN